MKVRNRYIAILSFVSMMSILLMRAGIVSIYICVAFHLFLLIGVIVLDFIETRRITLFQTWNFGYIYIIWSEMMLKSTWSDADRYINAITFLLIANSILLLGYISYTARKKQVLKHFWLMRSDMKSYFWGVLLLMSVLWLTSHYAAVVLTSGAGRQMRSVAGGTSIVALLLSASSLMVPAMAAYYYRYYSNRNMWWSILFLLPVFIFQMMLGTRFRLIYMIMPWLVLMGIIGVKRQKVNKLVLIMLLVIVLSALSAFMKENRYSSFEEMEVESIFASNERTKFDAFVWLASKMSPEGCVHMTFLSEEWFSTHEYEYGREIGFMFYWVVPRAIWKDKPMPIDYWLIRKYEHVTDTLTTASGFTGEIRADFGYWCLIIVFFFGRLLHRIDNYVLLSFRDNLPYLDKIIAALFYPCVFFTVRSPLTATSSFFVEVMIYMAIRKWMGRKCESSERLMVR